MTNMHDNAGEPYKPSTLVKCAQVSVDYTRDGKVHLRSDVLDCDQVLVSYDLRSADRQTDDVVKCERISIDYHAGQSPTVVHIVVDRAQVSTRYDQEAKCQSLRCVVNCNLVSVGYNGD